MEAPRRFTCDSCGGTFDAGWSDEERDAEAVELWGETPTDAAVVCDDCFQAMQAVLPIADFRRA